MNKAKAYAHRIRRSLSDRFGNPGLHRLVVAWHSARGWFSQQRRIDPARKIFIRIGHIWILCCHSIVYKRRYSVAHFGPVYSDRNGRCGNF